MLGKKVRWHVGPKSSVDVCPERLERGMEKKKEPAREIRTRRTEILTSLTIHSEVDDDPPSCKLEKRFESPGTFDS